ncbi:hypothetical protein B0H67DRAFT_557830 [Lasiosphaeris hirsuta]|uniref:Uncharacterized protein n=1 Tax=Lasiosphaeris hirsuta TaxID=260670 RepID=A0AA39ZWZ2_9PEZI|nr:hypothetical protein B0H67DRAFT_557830 [Lasiosphaeris hirsuta]
MTLLGPLTTTFKAPSSCTTNTPQIYQIVTSKKSEYVQGPLFTAGSNCYPNNYDASPSNYYSPGFCPFGYTAACTSLHSVTETALICCPTALSYTCLANGAQAPYGCTTSLKNAVAVVGVTIVEDGTAAGTTTVTKSDGGFAAHSIQVRFGASDSFPAFTGNPNPSATASPTTAINSNSASTSVSLPTQVIPAETETPNPKSGISTGTAVGIGVGSALAAVIISGTVGLFFFLRWRRKRHARPPVPPKEPGIDPSIFGGRASTYAGTLRTMRTTTVTIPPAYELSDEVSTKAMPTSKSQRSEHWKRERQLREGREQETGERDAELESITVQERGRERASQWVVADAEELDAGDDGKMRAELDAGAVPMPPMPPLEKPEPSLRSPSTRRNSLRTMGSIAESQISSAWTVRKTDGKGVMPTPWI